MTKITIMLLLLSGGLFAVPANPEPGVIRYSDETALTVYLRGDENISWHESRDGYRLLKTRRGHYEYASVPDDGKIRPSGIRAHDPRERNAEEKAFIADLSPVPVLPETFRTSESMKAASPEDAFARTDFPTLGEQKFLLILVEFGDRSFTHRPADFDSLMNAEHYDYNGAYGSVRRYYRDASFGRFDPHFDVAGPVRLDSSWAFYGKGDDENIQSFVHEAVRKADPLVDFTEYDNDGDGFVDNIYFIYAGYGECFYGADVNTIWPHRWVYHASTLTVDGKRVYDYSASMEFYGTSGTTRTSIGVICHEFGHVCGLPDYYDTDYDGSGGNCGGLGQWDLMAGGSWNDGGRKPPLFNAWSRMYLRWAEPAELSGTEHVTIDPAHSHNEVRYFPSKTEGEFFMMENRQRASWDASLPGHGLLIFHVDRNHAGWSNNTLNCDPARQGFDLEEADGYGNITASSVDGGDPFPGSSGNREFTDTGDPNALDWSGQRSRNPLREITEQEGVIRFRSGEVQVDPPQNFRAAAAGYDSVRISWSLNAAGDSVIMLASGKDTPGYLPDYRSYAVGERIAGGEVIYKGLDTVFHHTDLLPGSRFYYGIFSFNDSACVYSVRREATAVTASPPFFETDFSEGLPEGWLVFDRTGNGSWSAENPGNRSFQASSAGNGFMIVDSEHAGEAKIDAELITRSFNFALSRSVILRFEHKLEVASLTLARVLYTVNDGVSWYEAQRWTRNTADPETVEIDLSAAVGGFRDVKFKFNYRGTNEKYWCIDDLSILSALSDGAAAGFDAAEHSGPKPLTVRFMNTSVAVPDMIDTVVWDFGDGSDFRTDPDPVHTYTRSGTYDVSLMIRANGLQSDHHRDDFVQVINHVPVYTGNDTLDLRKNTETALNLNRFFSDPNGDPLRYTWKYSGTDLSIAAANDSVIPCPAPR
ncbi:MAG: M6 family metalloprotease domain-containing protein [Candidatus Marinimicrobia bacterium]|nr:M6 family metalloprotease domain-containing protein [Candidatus Neomarinimicrobiota bacterium]